VERLKQVGIILHGLSPLEGAQLSLFASGEEYALQRKWDTLSDVSDHLSARFGARALMQGHVPPQPPGGYAGAKIAFNRVPALSDFDIPGVSRDPGKARDGFGAIPNPLTSPTR
jgi:DNA polymerase-4